MDTVPVSTRMKIGYRQIADIVVIVSANHYYTYSSISERKGVCSDHSLSLRATGSKEGVKVEPEAVRDRSGNRVNPVGIPGTRGASRQAEQLCERRGDG